MTVQVVRPAKRLRGTIAVPGDKSISHRAAMLNALADGDAEVHNFLTGDDCLSTLGVLRALGATCDLDAATSVLRVRGLGLDGLHEAGDVLDCGNSGTTMRLMCGILAGQPFHSVLTGDESLRSRPMGRVAEPLRQMGAHIDARNAGNLVPPYSPFVGGVTATIEFAVVALKIANIIICGHSECGAMTGLLAPETIAHMPNVSKWLKHAAPVHEAMANAGALGGPDALSRAIEANIIVQLDHLRTHPCVAEALAAGRLDLHGWVYDIATGKVNLLS